MKKIKRKYIVPCILGLSAFLAFSYVSNNHIVVSDYLYINDKIPKDFDGYKIVHVSDLHNKCFGRKQTDLLQQIRSAEPDCIVVTGDLVDSIRTDIEKAMDFINGAVRIAPVYYCAGNHERSCGVYDELRERLIHAGVTVLEDEKTVLKRGSAQMNMIGLLDPHFHTEPVSGGVSDALKRLEDENTFTMLLSHRPELIDLYAAHHMDLVFTGHAHGGQVRLPVVGGLYAPNQGILPKYSEGMHVSGETTQFISRGLGNSVAPLRVFNMPELIVVTLISREK